MSIDSNKDKEKIQVAYKALCEKIILYRKHYFEFAKPLVEDEIYDAEFKILLEFESKYSHLLDTSNSPTKIVGRDSNKHLSSVKHITPMLSLNNGWTKEDIYKFVDNINKYKTDTDKLEIVCEPKIDGISASLYYKNGFLVYVLTRGNGIEGDDITNNARHIPNIPSRLSGDFPAHLYIRGEIVLKDALFEEINLKLQKANKKIFSNPRNTVSGVTRQLQPYIFCLKYFTIYGYGIENSCNATHTEDLLQLQSWGFPVVNNVYVATSIEELLEYYTAAKTRVSEYKSDGVVYKINSHSIRYKMGSTNSAPRWAIAFKFPNINMPAVIVDIMFQLGRTGVLTPVAIIEPLQLEGVSIKRLTLHNIDYIKNNNITIGSTVFIKRAGGVIPTIVKTLPHPLNKYNIPTNCVSCDTDLILESKKLVCPNYWDCTGRKVAQISFFVSKNCFNIEGCSSKLIELLIINKKIIYAYNLFDLKEENLTDLKGFASKKIQNLISAVSKSKRINFTKFIFALGIPGVGLTASHKIAEFLGHIDKLQYCSQDDLIKLPMIGKEIAKAIKEYLSEEKNILYIKELLLRVELEYK